jgi:hypothetical protein
VFGGIKEDASDTEIHLHGATDVETVREIAREQSWSIKEVLENEHYTCVVFRQQQVEVFGPIVWIGFKEEAFEKNMNNEFNGIALIELNRNVHICRYMKYLLINAYRRSAQNIDTGCIVPHGY